MGSIKKVMTIEEALLWAFRDELPKRRDHDGDGFGAKSYSHPMWNGVAMGGRVDNWNREPGYPAAMGECHPDALVIEAAVLELLPDDIDITGYSTSWLGKPYAMDPVGIDVDTIAEQGCQDIANFVRIRSRLGDRPQVTPAAEISILPVRSDRGGNITVFIKAEETKEINGQFYTTEVARPVEKNKTRSGHYPQGAFSRLVYDPGRIALYLERAEYAAWRAALTLLVDQLTGQLSTIVVRETTAPQRPWDGETDEIAVHRDLRPAPRRSLGRRPTMPAAPAHPSHGPVRHIKDGPLYNPDRYAA